MFKKTFSTAFVLFAATLLAAPLEAYVGPGAGISVLGSLLGILATIVVAIGAVIFWPVRKMLKRRKANATAAQETAADPAAGKPPSTEA
ncbi:MAG: hypothetical protein RQ826_03850 [Xanthomonadales bacterium]|nr:hypothetical protein [Xanthomonadales bacterium]